LQSIVQHFTSKNNQHDRYQRSLREYEELIVTAQPVEPPVRVTIFKNRQNQAIRIPKAMSYAADIAELEINRQGDVITLRPVRGSWAAFRQKWADLQDPADDAFYNYLEQRHDVLEPSRVVFDDETSQ